MGNSLPLKGFKILDLSMRLPGPLASYHLEKMGAQITKFENIDYPDSFSLQGNLFKDWYLQLNSCKDIIKESFTLEKTKLLLHKILKEYDGAIIGLPKKLQTLLEIDKKSLLKLGTQKVFVYIYASQEETTVLHDLGALAQSKLLDFHLAVQPPEKTIIPPPFLPLAGLNFANSICNHFLAGLIWSMRNNQNYTEDINLSDETKILAKALLPSQTYKNTLFDHNGGNAFYHIYKLKDDSYIVLSLLEEKFRDSFLKAIDQTLISSIENKKSFNILSDYFKEQTAQNLMVLVQKHNLRCIDFISSI